MAGQVLSPFAAMMPPLDGLDIYQYSRAIYRSVRELVDPFATRQTRLEYRRRVLVACEGTIEQLASDPHAFIHAGRELFCDIRWFFPLSDQARVAAAVAESVGAAISFLDAQLESDYLNEDVH
jgi:hypothetical protein